MVRIAATLLVLGMAAVGVTAAQQPTPAPSAPEPTKLGRRVFEQRCSVCHTIAAARRYAPRLHEESVTGKENGARALIMNGSRRMPGFKYGLRPADVDAILAYLKSVPKPDGEEELDEIDD